MVWFVVGAWILAVLIAVVVLGACAYEIASKTKRLQADLRELQTVAGQLTELQAGLAAVQERLAATGLG